MASETSDEGADVERSANPAERGKWVSAGLGLLGVWLIVQAYLFDLAIGQYWNDVVVGVLLAAVGGYNFSRRASERLGDVGAAVLATLLGVWLVAAPFMFGAGRGLRNTLNGMGFWNDVLVGLLAIGLGVYSVYHIRNGRRSAVARTSQ